MFKAVSIGKITALLYSKLATWATFPSVLVLDFVITIISVNGAG
jgi:hypothetical protein